MMIWPSRRVNWFRLAAIVILESKMCFSRVSLKACGVLDFTISGGRTFQLLIVLGQKLS